MIATLSITILIESIIAGGYAGLRRKPVIRLLLSCLLANLLTQPLLWLVLQIFFQHYLMTLLIAEFWIWIIEALVLFFLPHNRLRLSEALSLSLVMNLASFVVGWFLPV